MAGIPAPTASWRFNDEPLPADVTTESANSHTTLTTKQARIEHAGKYVLQANNVVGSASAEFNVLVKGMYYNWSL